MAPSQLKQLKTSLRESGITGPPKSKKQKKSAKPSSTDTSKRNRQETLQHIRDSFNPFEIRAVSSRPVKHQHVTNGHAPRKYRDVLHRPGITKSAGEEMRRAKLLPELLRRNKVGGVVDRRIGEGDQGMTPEERGMQRFAAEKGRKSRRNLFDLEDSDEETGGLSEQLTHGGRALGELEAQSFGEDSESDGGLIRKKRKLAESEGEDEEANNPEHDDPQREKSHKEKMEEVIAKSKYHKYERQKAKEDDDDLREELDKGMNDMLALLRGQRARPPPPEAPAPMSNGTESTIDPDRLKLLEGMDRNQADREYDARLKQYAQDAKAQPSDRTKTEEEKIREEAERLKDLQDKRDRRMKGEDTMSNIENAASADQENRDETVSDSAPDEAAQFGLTALNTKQQQRGPEQIVLEDEDEFDLDDDLVANDSDIDLSAIDSESESEGEAPVENGIQDAEEDEFVKGILGDTSESTVPKSSTALAYTYPCPRDHEEFLRIVRDTPIEQLPTIIQRIRALHHPSLGAGNKEAMADFSAVLVEQLSYMGLQKQSLAPTEQVIRHLHSLSRTYPERIAEGFRLQLKSMHERKHIHPGDILILMAVGSIYPTSDHWHQVVTPAMTIMARWLGMNSPDSDIVGKNGAFLVALCVKFQKLSKRVVPEALRFTLRALNGKSGLNEDAKKTHIENLMAMADLWKGKSAFIELFTPALTLLRTNGAKSEHKTLEILLQSSRLDRRPLELHHHRPLPIRTQIPKFEETFNPDKHYDPDKERSDSRKLQNEYKRERKGALRELRKDANFVARQKLSEKKEADREYDRKYRRLVAEVQAEAGRDGKEYEREKEKEKAKNKAQRANKIRK